MKCLKEDCRHYAGAFESGCFLMDNAVGCEDYDSLTAQKDAVADAQLDRGDIPPQLTEILRTFPFVEPDRIVKGEDESWLMEWWAYGYYFEIEYTSEGEIGIMTKTPIGETGHWTLIAS